MPFKKTKNLDILKEIHLKQDDADRIMGGLLRLEIKHGLGKRFVKESLKIAKNEREINLIWYAIGLRINVLSEIGLMVPQHAIKKKDRANRPVDPSVQ